MPPEPAQLLARLDTPAGGTGLDPTPSVHDRSTTLRVPVVWSVFGPSLVRGSHRPFGEIATGPDNPGAEIGSPIRLAPSSIRSIFLNVAA